MWKLRWHCEHLSYSVIFIQLFTLKSYISVCVQNFHFLPAISFLFVIFTLFFILLSLSHCTKMRTLPVWIYKKNPPSIPFYTAKSNWGMTESELAEALKQLTWAYINFQGLMSSSVLEACAMDGWFGFCLLSRGETVAVTRATLFHLWFCKQGCFYWFIYLICIDGVCPSCF